MGSSTSARTPTIMKRWPRSVMVLLIGSAVPKRVLASLVPMTAVGVSASSRRKVPFLRFRFWIFRKSGFVPTMVAEGTMFSVSPLRELTETARGETAAMPSTFSMVLMSLRVRLDFKY